MKKIIFLLFTLSIVSCGNDESTPSYAGKYYMQKRYDLKDGVKTFEVSYENDCLGKTSYTVNSDNSVLYEFWGPSSGKCQNTVNYNYTYDVNNNTINGQKVNFDGNNMRFISNTTTDGHNIETTVLFVRK